MQHPLYIYNTISRKKEIFIPLNEPFAGLYVCGPTVYGEPHLGHARSAINFDVLYRHLRYLGYKVRYVRNITDVGHLENDSDTGEDKISKQARLEKTEPMQVVQYYMNRYHLFTDMLNVLRPDIEPRATGHIIEQQQMIDRIIAKEFAYESNGSVYFDVEKYNKQFPYGKLSGRKTEDLMENTRQLESRKEKRSPLDFALWKKASPEHIMRWPSAWSDGFPGWHLECSAMSEKYLGKRFDIHGGGMDLLFPHHECELAQNTVVNDDKSVKYWVHNNMITINGQKMGKSLGNFITLNEFFTGNHKALEKAYSPATIRFFILQAHYRSTLDFSNAALQAAEKGLEKLQNGIQNIDKINPGKTDEIDIEALERKFTDAINDDLNTPILMAHMFDGIKKINTAAQGKIFLTAEGKEKLKTLYTTFSSDILGIQMASDDEQSSDVSGILDGVINLLLQMRLEAKKNKDWETADKIRDELNLLGIEVIDTKEGFEWKVKQG